MNKKINLIKIFLLCPVPDEQKPISEYINLKKFFYKKQKIFNFFKNFKNVKSLKNSNKELNFFFKNFNKLKDFLKNQEFEKILINFFLLIRWKDLENRLNNPTIIYEETSWYDGQVWEKSLSIIKNDRLLNVQIIEPTLNKTLKFLGLSLILTIFYFFYVFSFF